MKKALKALTAVGTAALAVVGGICVYRKFFAKDEEFDELFEEDDLDETEDEILAFDSEDEIFEDEEITASAQKDSVEESLEKAEAPSAEEVVAVEAGCAEEDTDKE
ncbi:MAG: hypothetical protein IKV59_04110 [Lachnospiraceae bacterium]|nr:hypothetical protein [Lachnospiraceae bacterium]